MMKWALLAVGLAANPPIGAQSFDVVSIKPSAPGPAERISVRYPAGIFREKYRSLKALVDEAFDVKPYQVYGAADWMVTGLYDVDAKAEGKPSQELTRRMLKTMLAERFQLKIHRETRELAVYGLVVGRNGPKLKESTRDAVASGYRGTQSQLTFSNASMRTLTDFLGGRVDRPVLDLTGLTKNYDFKLEWAPDEAAESNSPSIFTALQEQLGLKLEAMKRAVEIVVIDHAEKPSAN